MSGLAGCVCLDGVPVDPGTAQLMAQSTPYLGPDGVEVWCGGPAAFIRFTHATTPEGSAERQPVIDDRAGLTVCFDGRFDNRGDLLRDLQGGSPAVDPNASDASILLALFAREGDGCVKRL